MYNYMQYPVYTNINTAFQSNIKPLMQSSGYDPKAQFSNNGFVNKNDLYMNNISENFLNEEIKEYSVMIDSKDRNYQIYTNPFEYTVTFNPLPSCAEYDANGKKIISQTPNPVINDNFVNIKYIKLDRIILPYYTTVKQNLYVDVEDSDDVVKLWDINTDKNLTDDLYVIMSIGSEYTDNNYRSTNDVLADSFATIYYDSNANKSHWFGSTSNGYKIFPQDQLGKLDKLRIKFYNPYGVPLNCPHLDKNIRSDMQCVCTSEYSDPVCFRHNLFHPLNPIYQHHIHLKVGVVIPRIKKNIFS